MWTGYALDGQRFSAAPRDEKTRRETIDVPFYESVLIARQDVSAAQVEGLVENFTGIVGKLGGNVHRTEYWGLRGLAYRIKKNRKAHYVLMQLDAPSAAVLEMERNMRLHEDVLRYMTIRIDELDEEPSVIMQSRDRRDREDRPRRDHGDRPKHDDRPPRDGGDAPAKEAADAAAPAEAPQQVGKTADTAGNGEKA